MKDLIQSLLGHAVHADVLDNDSTAFCGCRQKPQGSSDKSRAQSGGQWPGGEGRVPLHVAPRDGITDVVRVLLDHDADAHVRDSTKNTKFHFEAAKRCLKVIRMLPAQGGGDNGVATATPLHEVSAKGHRRVLWLLLERAADANVYDPFPIRG